MKRSLLVQCWRNTELQHHAINFLSSSNEAHLAPLIIHGVTELVDELRSLTAAGRNAVALEMLQSNPAGDPPSTTLAERLGVVMSGYMSCDCATRVGCHSAGCGTGSQCGVTPCCPSGDPTVERSMAAPEYV